MKNEIVRRGIKEVLHFTTDRGLLGTMKVGGLLSRKQLPEEEWLEFILKPNVVERKDTAWLDYVNLSITTINHTFFEVCSGTWHTGDDGLWWCVLSFNPTILEHRGVWFASTNNFYPSVLRGQGVDGLDRLFATEVKGRYSSVIRRAPETSDNQPTDPQAEVLYPESLSLDHLQRAYFLTDEHADYFETLCSDFQLHRLAGKAVVSPGHFRED